MRDSIGAAWIFSICLTFTILIVGFLAISINYARSFKMKSEIITKIEEHEGYTDGVGQEVSDFIIANGYTAYGNCENSITVQGYDADWNLEACINDYVPAGSGQCNVCVYRKTSAGTNGDICAQRSSYRVVTFFRFDLPIIKYLASFQVSGESRYIYDFANSPGC